MTDPWKALGAVPPADLHDARVQLHWAAQVAQSHSRSLLVPHDDDGHACLLWDDTTRMLVGRLAHHHHLALRPDDLTLVFLDADRRPVDELALAGHTFGEAHEWLRTRMQRNATAHTIDTPWDLDDHPLSDDEEPFLAPKAEIDPAALTELARWFAAGDAWLRGVAATHNANEVRVWTHHLDIATLIELPPTVEPGFLPDDDELDQAPPADPSIGIGLSPGDGTYDEPYFYISPWPYPTDDEPLPSLSEPAYWHGEHFVAAVLTATDLFASDDRAATVKRYTDEAVSACLALQARRAEAAAS